MSVRRHIAIVDDEESFRVALLRVFRHAGYSAEAFPCASSLLQSLATRIPDCIVVDLQMPGMTGVELMETLNRTNRPPPVVVVTALDGQRSREDCLALGTRHYLSKPVDMRTLLEAVHDALLPQDTLQSASM